MISSIWCAVQIQKSGTNQLFRQHSHSLNLTAFMHLNPITKIRDFKNHGGTVNLFFLIVLKKPCFSKDDSLDYGVFKDTV